MDTNLFGRCNSFHQTIKKIMFESYYTKEEKEDLSLLLKPPAIISGSEWANAKRILSKEDSSEPGKYNTERAPFQKEILDECTNPLVERVVFVSSRQIGKTLIATNTIGYYIDIEPSPIMYMIETLEKAENFSKVRLDAMIRDNDWMRIDRKIKTSGNTIREKHFPGGYLSLVGANSASGLSSKVIRILIGDEVDGYPLSAGTMGSPLEWAINTTETFDNRKIILLGSPGIEDLSVIWRAYLNTDQRKYHLPCPKCGFPQELVFEQLKFPDFIPEFCYYECLNCKAKLEEKNKFEMLPEGEWIKTFPERINKPGFHISRLYSPFSSWSKMVEEFLHAKKQKDEGIEGPYQVFWNTSLARTYNPYTAPTSVTELEKRTETYLDEKNIILPSKVVLLTAGIDVQDDRLEIEIDGWGVNEESWVIEYKILTGEPALPGLWNELDEYLKKKFKHPSGLFIGITAAGIDTGGHHTQKVYDFVRGKQARRIYGIRGASQPGKPIAPRKPSYNNKGKIPLYFIGTSAGKDVIYSRLRLTEPGPGYMHFEKRFCDEEYFRQLTSNKKVRRKSGYEYELLPGRRDEVLDCKNYSYAALRIYNRDLRLIKNLLERMAKNINEEKPLQIKTRFKKSFATR